MDSEAGCSQPLRKLNLSPPVGISTYFFPVEFNLKRVLRALLLSTSEPISIKDIQKVVQRYHDERRPAEVEAASTEPTPSQVDPSQEAPVQEVIQDIIDQVPTLVTATQIRESMEQIDTEFRETGEVCRILQGPEGFRLVVSTDYAQWVRLLRGEVRPQRLSPAALETLAIIAYRQPVTRGEMESIRGVSIESALQRLLELELAQVTGRADLPGRPLQYGTTDKFLDFTGLRSLGELPASDVLSPALINEWITRATAAVAPTEGELGLVEETPPPTP